MVAVTAPVQSQGGPAAAAGWFDASRLQVGTDSLEIYLSREDGRHHLGTLWDELVRVDWNGAPAVRRTYRTTNRLFGNHYEVSHSAYPSLQPLSDRTDAALIQNHTIYRSDSVVGWSQIRDSARIEFAVVASPFQYDGQAVDLIVRSADLAPGFRRSFEAFLPGRQKAGRMELWVTGSDTIPGSGGTPAEVWVVELDFADLGSTMWIDKRTRALHRQVIRIAAGVEIIMERRGGA